MIRRSLALGLLALLGLVPTEALAALQAVGGEAAGPNLRPYRFLFAAYALAWLLVFGWVVSVGRRLAQVARRLEE